MFALKSMCCVKLPNQEQSKSNNGGKSCCVLKLSFVALSAVLYSYGALIIFSKVNTLLTNKEVHCTTKVLTDRQTQLHEYKSIAHDEGFPRI